MTTRPMADVDIIAALRRQLDAAELRSASSADALDMADQLEAAQREIELMRPVVDAAEQIRNADSVGRQLIGGLDSAVDAYRAAKGKAGT